MSKKHWVKKSHYFFKFLLTPYLTITSKTKFKARIERCKELKGPTIILCNHETSYDQFFVSQLTRKPIYFVATEDIFSNGFSSKLIKMLANPISKTKSVSDMSTIFNILQVIRENGIVAIFPEGNRTYSSKMCNIDPAIAKLLKKGKADVAFANITGGYTVEPRWANKNKDGHINCKITHILKKEQLAEMSVEEIYQYIIDNLDVSKYEVGLTCNGKNRAEYMERLFYVCPNCHKLETLYSQGNDLICSDCGNILTYNTDMSLTSPKVNFNHIFDYYQFQKDFICKQKLDFFKTNIISDVDVEVKEVIINKRKIKLGKASIAMDGTKLFVHLEKQNLVFPFEDIIAITCLGKKKMNVYLHNNKIYQFGADKFNPVKYMFEYYHVNNMKGENYYDSNDGTSNEFLGI